MSGGWHVSQNGRVLGPFTWERALEMAREGWLEPDDLVMRPGSEEWVHAHEVPAFFPTMAEVPADASAESPAEPVAPVEAPAQASTPPPRKRKRPSLKVIGALAAAVALGVVAFLAGPELLASKTIFTPSSATDIIQTKAYGNVPGNRLGVALEEGATRADAERLASQLGGSIVGEIGDVGLYLIQIPTKTEEALAAALKTASAAKGVAIAFPDQEAVLATATFYGVRCNLFDDIAYDDGLDRPQRMIGAQGAADIIRSCDLKLSPVDVAVVDSGLYRTKEIGGKANWHPDQSATITKAELDEGFPEQGIEPTPLDYMSHGTAVASIIGADADNGGMTGIASVLGENLTLHSKNMWAPQYGTTPAEVNSKDITVGTQSNGETYSFGALVALKDAVERDGARVVNCSFGSPGTPGDAGVSAAYKRFFEYMNLHHPKVVFVCAAGNETGVLTDYWPGGIPLPNVVTVGSLDENGNPASYTNRAGPGSEVTLSAQGDNVVGGIRPDGTPIPISGTSFAAPQVTSTVAMMLAANPDLTAADIKRILSETARTSVASADGSRMTSIDPSVGGRCLAADQAVLQVVNDQRAKEGKPPLALPAAPHPSVTRAGPRSGSTAILLRAMSPPRPSSGPAPASTITADIAGVGEGGADIAITVEGGGTVSGGVATVHLIDPVMLIRRGTPEGGTMVVHVSRSDSGACWRVRFGPDVRPDEPDLADAARRMAKQWADLAKSFADRLVGRSKESTPTGATGAAGGATEDDKSPLGTVRSWIDRLSDPWRSTAVPDIRGTWVSTVPGKGYEMSGHVDGYGSSSESADVVMKIDVQEGAVARGEMHVDNYTYSDDPYEWPVPSVSPDGIPPVPAPQRVADGVHWPEGPIFPITAIISGNTVKITPAGIGNGTYDNGATCMEHRQLLLLGRLDGEVFSGTTVLVIGPRYPQDIGVGTWPWWSGGEDWDSLIPADSSVESSFSLTREK